MSVLPVTEQSEKMRILFIDDDDDLNYVDDIVTTLQKTGLFECVTLDHYDKCGTTMDEVRSYALQFDLFVLDVLMEGPNSEGDWSASNIEFASFINWIGRERPFIAYTQMDPEDQVGIVASRRSIDVGELVHSNGGLCCITKNDVGEIGNRKNIRKMHDEVCERILGFYWSVRSASRFTRECRVLS